MTNCLPAHRRARRKNKYKDPVSGNIYFDLHQCQQHVRSLFHAFSARRGWTMKAGLIVFGALIVALAGPAASAQQVLNLSGQFRCVQGCLGPGPAYVTQNGWDLNLVNEVGQPSRAWIDWPGHIWAQYWNEGAVYSPDGMTIQFDRGSVWVRNVEPPPPPPPPARVRG
jgi:hypothetical protein